jgi:hypothetical protein
MTGHNNPRVAILYPGDAETRRNATPHNNRFSPLFQALADLGVQAEPAVYHDVFWEEVRQQLLQVDAVLVWVNPIEGGRDRTVLDALLRDVAATGVFVSAHPDIILKMGTKEVLYRTRTMAWGCDTALYATIEDLRRELPMRLARGEVRVLKQNRGQSGSGVWKIEAAARSDAPLALHQRVRVRHAQRGGVEEEIPLDKFMARCEPYFATGGRMIDQVYQSRLNEGMFRCYLVHDKVAGFGFQAINALYPALPDLPPTEAPQPGPRLYYPPTMAEGQLLKRRLEEEWLPTMQQLLDIPTTSLPVLWDADFLLGPKGIAGEDSYVLCEINVSSVAPFPDAAIPMIAKAVVMRAEVAS